MTVASGTEIVVCVGFPGSGKSNFSKEVFVKGRGYEYVNQDTMGDKTKCLKATRLFASQNKSCVIDNTNGNPAVRAEYIQIAKDHSIPIRCLWFTTPIEIAKHLNLNRSAVTEREKVPDIAYNMYKSKFKAPSKAEGFASVQEIPFHLHFTSEIERRLFLQYS